MRIVFVTIDYPDVLQSIYGSDPTEALRASYADLLRRRNATLFSRSDYVTHALEQLGHDTEAFYLNNLPLQIAWRRERNGSGRGLPSPALLARQIIFRLRRLGSRGRVAADRLIGGGSLAPQSDVLFDSRNPAIQSIAAKQIAKLKPDVIYNYDAVLIDGHFLKSIPGFGGKLVTQIAAPYPQNMDWRPYDLVISSLPNFVERFQKEGVPTAYLPLYFTPEVLDEIGPKVRDLSVTFIGSVSRAHAERRKFLEQVADRLPLDLYGSLYGEREGTPLARSYRHQAWGRDMYAVLARSRLTLNKHIDIAEGYSNNLRLYEATGMGACLVTERGSNLPELFEPGREVVAYDNVEECVDLCSYYLKHPREAAAIAEAGQRRCLSDHTVQRHAEKLTAILRAQL
jgi:hypothetical protein